MTSKIIKTLQFLLLLGVILGSHYFLPIQTVIRPPYTYLGIPLIILGIWLNVCAASRFREGQASFRLKGVNSALFTDGPFRFSRNPIYLGIILFFLGLAILLGSLIVFIYPAMFFVLFQFFLLPQEERKMEDTFGEVYREYKRTVRRWI